MLKISNITKKFGGLKALDKCSLNIEKGKIIALIGPNGSGKSTLFNIISNIEEKDSGKIYLDDINITKFPAYKISSLGVSRTFQEVRLFKNLTIKDHLEIALNPNDSLISSVIKKKDYSKEISEILDLVGLKKPKNTLVTDLSYGQRKLLDLAIAVAKPHSLLMLDEPVAGVNPQLRKEIKKILRKLNKNGETILLIEHDMSFVMDLAEYIFVLDAGKVIAEGNPKEIQRNKKVLEAYLGD